MTFTAVQRRTVRTLLDRLTAQQRQLVELEFWEGFSLTEAAAHVGVTWENAVRERRAALDRLQDLCLEHPEFGGQNLAA